MEQENYLNGRAIEDLPVIKVDGLDFYVDATRNELIEVANPTNCLSWDNMLNLDSQTVFIFIRSDRSIFEGKTYDPYDNNLVQVQLRPIAAIDPKGMEMLIEQGQYRWVEHYQQELPETNIGGTQFYIDPVRESFREVENRFNVIPFTDVEQLGGFWGIFYDKQSRNTAFPGDLKPAALAQNDRNGRIVFSVVPGPKEIAKLIANVQRTTNPVKKDGYIPVRYNLHFKEFEVDVSKGCLYQRGLPNNEIFFSQMTYKNGEYSIGFDTALFKVNEQPGSIGFRMVSTPALIDLDPFGLEHKYGISFDGLSDKQTKMLRDNEPEILLRLAGELPKVMIDHWFYNVDVKAHKLIPFIEGDGQPIDFKIFRETASGRSVFILDTRSGKAYSVDILKNELPADALMVYLPPLRELDPIGMAQSEGKQKMAYAINLPIRPYVKAQADKVQVGMKLPLIKKNGKSKLRIGKGGLRSGR